MSDEKVFLGGGVDEILSLVKNTASLKDGLKGIVPEQLLGPIEGISKRLTDKLKKALPTNITMNDLPSLALKSATLTETVDSIKQDCEQLSNTMEQLRDGKLDLETATKLLNSIGKIGVDKEDNNG